MKYTEARPGRIFILRLEDGETVHEEIEKFSREHSIRAASVMIIGGADKDSRLITGPARGREYPIVPMEHILKDVHESAGVGTLFPMKMVSRYFICTWPAVEKHRRLPVAYARGSRCGTSWR